MTPTDEQLNIALCEWMGWVWVGSGANKDAHWYRSEAHKGQSHFTRTNELPDYLSDDSPRRLLNEAETKLTDDEWIVWLDNAADALDLNMELPWGHLDTIATQKLTARQRVIALLQVVKPEMFK